MIVRVLIALPVPMVFQSQVMERFQSIQHRQIGQASNISSSDVKVKTISLIPVVSQSMFLVVLDVLGQPIM